MSESKRIKTSASGTNAKGQVDKGILTLERPITTDSVVAAFLATREPTIEDFPPEMLELIFKKVESPKDLLSCWNTNPAWRSALRSTDFYFKMTFPFVLPYLRRIDVLACSSVSKSWNVTVDDYVQEVADYKSDSTRDYVLAPFAVNECVEFPDYTNPYRLDSGQNVRVVNPVALRRAHVDISFAELGREDEQLYQDDQLTSDHTELLKWLDHFGHLIRYLSLHICDEENVSCLVKMKLIQSCLTRTPNLHLLLIEALSVNDEDPDANDLAALTVYISENPWPSLEQLKVIEMTRYGDATQDEYASLANAYAPQLRFLRLGCQIVEPLRPFAGRFSCLQEIIYYCFASCNAMEFATFVQASQCPLKHLMIIFNPNQDLDEERCNGFTMAANAAKTTIETLVFHHSVPNNEINNFDLRKFDQLRLPRLNVFHLKSFGYPSLGFLKRVCPSLGQLTLLPAFPNHTSSKKMKNGKMYSDLYSQNQFWNQLAEIEHVEVKCLSGWKTVLVNGKRKGIKIKKKIPGHVTKSYTRCAYEAKVDKDRAVGVDNQASAARIESENLSGRSQEKCHEPENENAPDVLITRSKKNYERK